MASTSRLRCWPTWRPSRCSSSVKESSDNVRRITDIINLTGPRYRIFTGVDNLALESFAMGAVGWVAGLVAAFPAETVAIWKLAEAGRLG